jgi:predicted transcriptional regulator
VSDPWTVADFERFVVWWNRRGALPEGTDYDEICNRNGYLPLLLVAMLTIELAQYYGISDSDLCSEFVKYINGILSFAEKGRLDGWNQFCAGLCSFQTKFKELEALNAQLNGKCESRSKKITELTRQLKENIELTQGLNETNKEYLLEIESLKSQLSCPPAPSVASDPKSGRGKRQASESPLAESEKPPVKKPVDRTVESELREEIARLNEVNERLDGLLKASTEFEVSSHDVGKGRISAEEVAKIRKQNASLMDQLKSITEESRRMAYKYSEYIQERDAAHDKARLEWKKRFETLKAAPPPPAPPPGILLPTVFSLPNGAVMVCPVPTRTGRMVQLLEVYKHWIQFPCDNEGTWFASFFCPFTSQFTSLASVDQILLTHSIAIDLQLYVIPPLRFQYLIGGTWVDFSFIDQICIASLCCKIHRQGVNRVTENLLVCHGDYLLSIHVTSDATVDLQMKPAHNVGKILPACLHEGVVGFFPRWTFTSPQTDAGASVAEGR